VFVPTESPNRIEGVTVAPNRLRPLLLGNTKPRDRSEQEIQRYQHRNEAGRYISLERLVEESKEVASATAWM
jgi:hypothetical protein